MEKITQYLIQSTVHGSEVRAWEEDIMLPTYEIGKEEKNPIFLEKYLLKTIQPFYLLFYNLLIPFNSDLSFTSLMLIA
jgi:hypothetical protein